MNGLQHTRRIMVIDDHPLFRKGVAQLLEFDPRFDVVGEAASGEEGLSLLAKLHPDLVLLDLQMKGMSGIDALKAVKSQDPQVRVIMLTVSDSEEDLVAALRAGADGYLLKDMEPEDLVDRLDSASHGRVVLSEILTDMLAHAMRSQTGPVDTEDAELTERERQILEYIAAGLSNKLIARQLGITENTVKVHVKHVLKKLNLRSRLEAAVWAIQNGHGTPGQAPCPT
ncbi:MAG TPA: two-component system response regulator NarL [Gammaproteobacteria bacterium]|nr:two-component system response regulator NarL [Gammaproteobacteria bacterium]